MTEVRKTHKFAPVTPTPSQERALDEARVAYMNVAGFFSHFYYDQMREVITNDVPGFGTDGRHLFINPSYNEDLKIGERVFAYIHETMHDVYRHPQQAQHFKKLGNVRGLPFNPMFANICMDYVINANIIEAYGAKVQFNPNWLFNPDVDPKDSWVDVYVKLWPNLPKPPKLPPGTGKPCEEGEGGEGGEGQGQGKGSSQKPAGLPEGFKPVTWKESGRSLRGAKGDAVAERNNGMFDENVLEPPVDPATGDTDLPDEEEFREAVARANEAQKNQGDTPACVRRIVKEVLEPEVDWKDKIRSTVMGKMGWRGEDWARPNRRRLVLKPLAIIPGKKRFGAGTVVVAQDTSGSMGTKEEAAGLAELSAVLNDARPKEIVRLCCDAAVGQVDYVRSIDDFEEIRDKGTTGGGGTDFRPVFKWIEDNLDELPEALIYVTDMFGTFPREAPKYPVMWVSTTKPVPPGYQAPFGEIIEIDINRK